MIYRKAAGIYDTGPRLPVSESIKNSTCKMKK
jgi:hypothetical protein